MSKYRTIVADPPWTYGKWGSFSAPSLAYKKPKLEAPSATRALPYRALSLEAITALPVARFACEDAHLYLWTTNRYLEDAFRVVRAWGFRYSQTLVWAKTPRGIGPGGAFSQNAEYVLFARRGKLAPIRRVDSVWFNWTRTGNHSQKPEHFIDLVEQVSPGPYLEMFSRRHRLGWDVWGDQVESSVDIPQGAA